MKKSKTGKAGALLRRIIKEEVRRQLSESNGKYEITLRGSASTNKFMVDANEIDAEMEEMNDLGETRNIKRIMYNGMDVTDRVKEGDYPHED